MRNAFQFVGEKYIAVRGYVRIALKFVSKRYIFVGG